MRRRERPILLGGVALALFVLAMTGGLVWYALAGVAAEARDRHDLVAERLFDAMEDELSQLVAREEARSFLEYRYYYVPPGNAYKAGLVQSELSRPPRDRWIVGWFQVDPGDEVTSPLVPQPNQAALALDNGYDLAADKGLERIRKILAGVAWTAPPEPAPAPDQEVAQNDSSKELQLNRSALKRADRRQQVVSTNSLNLGSFNPSSQRVDEWVAQQDAQPSKNDVNVVVSPISGVRVGDRLVLYRVVHTGGQDYRQGLILDLPELAEHLSDVALAGQDPLRSEVSFAFGGSEPQARRYRFVHRFAEPFGSMTVVASLDRLPELEGRDALTVPALAAAVLLAVFGGGLALGRAVRSELEYARRRQDFVAAVSHELKTPLTTIRLYAEMLRDGMVPGADRQRTYHHTITMESDRLGRLIANVLELARLERAGAAPELLTGSVEPVLREAVEIVRPHAEARGFAIEVEAEPDLPPVQIDRDALTQIVVNLVDNSVKFAAQGERRIELRLRREGGRVVLTVRDHGPGVPRAHLRKVFEPFWRGERELTRKTRGTGIGLALVRGLVERMGGSVEARNHPDGGLEIALSLGA